ncbi:hypothetical protein [Brevibacterium pigmentatum]|uniref:hypothetical protein n=1 Tax=Brevibacterium pigmentatum TaxID=1496080 RepID=UPI001421FB03|nr:hypothetical protein [Brevibacterium pigmentatum]
MIFHYAFLNVDTSAWEYGSVPDWISAVSTFLAFCAAAFAATYAFQQMKSAQDQVDALESEATERGREKRREQASQISAWLTKDVLDSFEVRVFNASNQPVYNAVLSFIAPNNQNDIIGGTLPPMGSPERHSGMSAFINSQRAEVKSIDLSWNLPNQDGVVKSLEQNDDGSSEWVEGGWRAGPIGIGITFTDTNGLRWERTIDGQLSEKPGDYKVSSSYVIG